MKGCLFFLAAMFLTVAAFAGKIRPAAIFGNDMVIQQGINAPVWGWASPGAELTIRFAGQTSSATADAEGKWMARMPVLQAGGPFEMVIEGEGESIRFENVMVGEVWLASGQSNMWWPVSGAAHAAEEIAAANYPQIRLFTVPQVSAPAPVSDISPTAWNICSPQTVKNFSAVGYYFARELWQHRKVAIGIIHASWGATPAEAWTSAALLATMPEFREKVLKMDTSARHWRERVDSSNRLDRARDSIARTANEGFNQGVQQINYEDKSWNKVDYPLSSGSMKIPGWGFVWIRKTLELPAVKGRQSYKLEFPYLYGDRVDIFFNGKQLTKGARVAGPVTYTVPASYIRKGENLIAIRNFSTWGQHAVGNSNEPAWFSSTDGKVKVPLNGEWRVNGNIEPPVAQWQNWYCTPTVLYNGMIAPIAPYGIRGVIWYQGESNAGNAMQYRRLFPLMIQDWRVRFRQGNIPFLFVQLANYMQKDSLPAASDWALLREAQSLTLQYPNTGMAVNIDIGEAGNIHPANKQEVARRLALQARKKVYKEEVVCSGPMYDNMKLEGNSVRLGFTGTDSGLRFKNNDWSRNFAVAGPDKVFYWATDVRIDGGDILVSCSRVPHPVAVRYAWGNNPDANLYNGAGLPADPFRTDDW